MVDGGFVRPVLAAAGRALGSQHRVIFVVVLALVAADVPFVLAQSAAQAAFDELGRAAGGGDVSQLTPEQAGAAAGRAAAGCCTWCGAQAYALFVVMPLVAGATVAGARAARGRARPGDLLAGFRRYGPTLVTTLATTLVGGGIAVTLVVATTLPSIGSATRTLGTVLPPPVVAAAIAALGAMTLWLTARLWFALTRVADPDRPRIGGVEAVVRSWQWTAGPLQWRIAALLLLCATAAVLLMLPGATMAGTASGEAPPPATPWGAAAALALGAIASVPVFLLVLGAAYERVASRAEPIAPPVAPAPAEGGFDA